ncbi:unnamed protein product, partial [Symbiodinium microadriaticum]
LQMHFVGQYYSCELLGRCDQDSLQDVFRQWMFDESVRKGLAATEPSPAVWPELRRAVAAEPALVEASAWVCTGIWPLCWMLQQLSQQPVLHYMVNWLVGEHTPPEWHVPLVAEAARAGGESIQSSQHHFCTAAWARLSVDISYLLGLKVPHAATVGWHTALHAGPGLRWAWRPGSPARAAVPRNVLTRRIQGQLFAAMFGHFNRLPWVQGAAAPVEVDVWQGGFDSINRGAGDPWQGQVRGKIWWSDAVEYMAAIYLAGDITLLTFSELYSLQVPTLVPHADWQARIMSDMCRTGIGWFHMHSPLYRLEGELTFPYSPWGCELDQIRYWLQTADAWRYPHVQHFHSFVDLYRQLLSWASAPEELERLRAEMEAFHLQLSRRTLLYFWNLLAAKLPELLLVPEEPSRLTDRIIAARRVSATHTLRRTLGLRASTTRFPEGARTLTQMQSTVAKERPQESE